MIRILSALFAVAMLSSASGQIVINEICAKPSERVLQYAADGSPSVGYGYKWNSLNFSDTRWLSGGLPAGWGSTVTTNLQSAMYNLTPTLYLRKTFTVTAGQAALSTPLILQVEADDGFVAYLNGVEIARANCGPLHHYMYSAQQAYNATTTSGIIEYTVGAANTLLVSGTNVLSIEAHNADFTSNFRINAGLRLITSNQNVTITNALYDFSTANGASRTHTNTNGTVTNTASGTPAQGGWLATAADPTSDSTWTSLQIVTSEKQGAGVGGSGGLNYAISQSGTNRGVVLHAPQVTMTGSWAPGGINAPALAATTVKFRYRTSGDVQFGFRLDPTLDLASSSADGFPTVGLPLSGTPIYNWAAAAGGFYGASIDASGTQSTLLGGSGINIGNYGLNIGAGVRSGSVQIKEDNTAGAGPGGSTGIFSWIFTTWPSAVDTLGFGIKNLTVSQWTAGSISATDFQRTRLSFRWKMPIGRTQSFYLESPSGSTAATRANIGTLVGTGGWETFSAFLSDIPNSSALLTKLNQSFSKSPTLTGYYAGVNFANGEAVQLDDLNLYYILPGTATDEAPAITFGGSIGAQHTRTINGSGVVSDSVTGTTNYNVTLNSDPALTGFVFRVTEDATVGAGNNGSTGFLHCDVTDVAETGGPWGFSVPGIRVYNWTPGNIATADLANVSFQTAVKIPAGISVQLFAEPTGGSAANRASLGTLTGNGTWQTITTEFATAGNVDAFRTALNAASTTTFQITFVGPNNAPLGDVISIDDPVILLWRTYQVTLDQSGNQQRFMTYLNQNSSISFVPAFSKTTAASTTGGSFSIDNFEVDYSGLDPSASTTLIASGATGGSWKYFVGLAEPSGGLFDPVLLTGYLPPGTSEEDDYSSPQSFQDWVELKNLGASPVTLTNWTLTDDPQYPAKWKFPSGTSIPANGYLIVMCDGRDEANGTATYIHTPFSISGGSPTVAIYNATGALQDQVSNAPSQDSFHTWGRIPDGTGAWGFLDVGTPGAANAGNFIPAKVKQPSFFQSDGVTNFSGGFYSGAQTLVISTATAGAQIRYTLDGTDPTETTGTVYTGPITLTPPTDHKTGIIVIARAFQSGMVKSDARTKTYMLDANASLKGVPALFLSGDPGRNFYVPAGIMAIVDGRSLPVSYSTWTPTGPQSYNIPLGHGDAYERAISAEWYYPNGTDGWREDVGIRISSSPYSRPLLRLRNTSSSPWAITDPTEKPSFDLYWRNDYGNSEVTDDNLIQGNDVNEYARLRIRAGKNDIDNPFIIDECGRRLYHDMGWVQPIGTINTLFVNGSFKGMFNTVERLRGATFAIHYRSTNKFDVNYIDTFVDGDNVFWNQMQTALTTVYNSPTPANYQAVQNYIDVVNVADCFLFWIYVNMDDWPTNNWAAQHERTPGGVYRMATWDIEGAFGRFGKAVNYDTINNNLLNASSTCGDIFKHLYASPEFKLLVADRIQKHFFNGGVLDDRVNGGHLGQLVNTFSALTQPVQTFIGAGNIDLSWYTNHIAGRRAFLFGTGTGSFQQTQLWPATPPPTFSQFGGVVGAGYQLTITTAAPTGSTIYYTLNGSDPRAAGGAVAAGAIAYTGPVTLNFLTTVNARVRLANGTWTALNSAYFEPAAAQPTGNTLVISEINYNPPPPTVAEEAAGFSSPDDFEFVRLTNVGATSLDLRGLRFTNGITYDFTNSAVDALNPGASVLVVRNSDAFQTRYGQSYNATIAGQYAGKFSDTGETVTLQLVNNGVTSTIETFAYGTTAPWPATPNGYGPTLMLANPAVAPIPTDPTNWIASAQMGGMPGGTVHALTYNNWKQLAFNQLDAANAAVSGATVDPKGDGLRNYLEYVLGLAPRYPYGTSAIPIARVENIGGTNYLTFQYQLNAGASDATVMPEISSDLTTWLNGAANIVTLNGPTANPNGSISWKVRDANPFSASNARHFHLKATGP